MKSLDSLPSEGVYVDGVRGFGDYIKLVEMHQQMPKIVKDNVEKRLSEEQLNTLQWAKEFMDRYERNDRRRIRKMV